MGVYIRYILGEISLVLILIEEAVKETLGSLQKIKRNYHCYDCIIIPTCIQVYTRWVVY